MSIMKFLAAVLKQMICKTPFLITSVLLTVSVNLYSSNDALNFKNILLREPKISISDTYEIKFQPVRNGKTTLSGR